MERLYPLVFSLSNGKKITIPFIYIFGIVFLIKLTYWLFFRSFISEQSYLFACIYGDTNSHIFEIEEGIQNGWYSGHRIPGYGLFYAFIRIFFSANIAVELLVVLQCILSVISVLYLAKLTILIFDAKHYYYPVLITYTICSYITRFDYLLGPESLSSSFTIFGFYYLYLATENNNKIKYYFIAGFFWGLLLFLRPFLFPFFIFLLIYIIYTEIKLKNSILELFKKIVCFSIIFSVLETGWIIRNYIQYNKLVPIQINVAAGDGKFTTGHLALFEYVGAWGGDIVRWNPIAEIRWFYYDMRSGFFAFIPIQDANNPIELPNYIYTSTVDSNKLRYIRKIFGESHDLDKSNEERKYLDSIAVSEFHKAKANFISEKPLFYYILSPLRLLYLFLFHSGTQTMFNEPFSSLPLYYKLIKLFFSSIFIFTTVFGTICTLILLIYHYNNTKLVFMSIYVWAIFFFVCYILRMIEYRYIVVLYPILMLFAVVGLYNMISKLVYFSYLSKNIDHDFKNHQTISLPNY